MILRKVFKEMTNVLLCRNEVLPVEAFPVHRQGGDLSTFRNWVVLGDPIKVTILVLFDFVILVIIFILLSGIGGESPLPP